MEEALTLHEALYFLTGGFFLILITSSIAYKFGFYKLQTNELSYRLPLKVVIISFAIFLIISIIIMPILLTAGWYYYRGTLNLSTELLILTSSFSIIGTFLGLGIFQSFMPKATRELIWGKYFGPSISLNKTIQDILIGFWTWFISFPFVIVAGKLVYVTLYAFGFDITPEQVAVNQVKMSKTEPQLFFLIAANIIFLVPVLEEFLFRGCLQTWLKGKIGVKKAIILASIIFACFHFSFSQGLGNIELLVSLFVLSCFLGFIYERQQSLLAPICLHAFFNAITVFVILFT